jgi:two-component system LytT family response regulator
MTLNAIIVEDEKISQEILRNYLQKYCPKVKINAVASNITEAFTAIQNHSCDLLFLDVEMPYGNAFDLLDKIEHPSFQTIFVTAYQQYAIDALNAHAAYYLLKPISIDELIKAVHYVEEIITKELELQQKISTPVIKAVEGKITIGTQDGFEILETRDILYCKADDNYTKILMVNDKKIASKTLKHFEDALSGYGFARVHKSFLVNVNHIQKYKKGKGGSVVLSNGAEVMVAPARKKKLLDFFR